MNTIPRPWLAGLMLVLLAMPASAQRVRPDVIAAAQPAPVAGPPRDDQTQLFRGLLHHFKIKPIAPTDFEYNKDSLVIVLGDPGRMRLVAAQYVNKTLAVGGSVLIASDTFLNLTPFFPDKEDLEIVGNEVTDPTGTNAYLGNPNCPFVKPYALLEKNPTPEEALFAGFERIATNAPTALRITKRPPYASFRVGLLPETARYTGGQQKLKLRLNDSFAAAGVGRADDTYRCLLMADHSLLSNDMLYSSADREPTDNFAFAVRLVPWLQGPENRRNCLFIENGKIIAKFDEFDFAQVSNEPPKPPTPPIPPFKMPDPMDRKFQETASKVVSEVVTKVEDNDSFKNGLARNTRAYVAIVSILVSVLLIFASVLMRSRLWKSRQARDYQPIPADPLRLGGDVPLGSFQHRRLELLRGNDFRAPFTEYVLLIFRERGLPDGDASGRRPKIEATGQSRQHLIDSVRRLWDEVAGNAGKPLAYTQWKALEPILASVRAAAEAERWRFAPITDSRTDSEGAA